MNDDASVLRTVILPDFTPEQTAYLDRLQAAARQGTFNERVGGPYKMRRPVFGRTDPSPPPPVGRSVIISRNPFCDTHIHDHP